MKTLVVYYSRTGTTKKVAEVLAQKMGASLEEIKDTIDRSGVRGYLISGRDAIKKKLARIEPLEHDAGEYDLVIIGTPIWGWNISSPIRTYVTENEAKFKRVAFFCTMGGSGDRQAFLEMERIVGQKPVNVIALKTVEVVKSEFEEKLENFIRLLRD